MVQWEEINGTMPGTDRRSSTSSEDASLPPTRQLLPDGTEFIPTRTAKTAAPKPAANPLQFIKVGPADLYKAAQEQLKKVEEIKKVEKTVKEEAEDWQSNLDNWKCSRRKRQEHIIERVVEVKKIELEEHERNKRRGKTLNEMMEERSQKGVGPRKKSLMMYPDEDPSDMIDLAIPPIEKLDESEQQFREDSSNQEPEIVDAPKDVPSPTEEYTYDRAIQGYKSYAEKSAKSFAKLRVSPPKPGSRIGEKLNELEQVRLRSNSVTDVQLPKVDIHKRRSLFEVVESAETKSPSAERIAKDLGDAKIVRERLSSLGRQPDVEVKSAVVPEEISLTLKDRLSHLEKQTFENESPRCLPCDGIGLVSVKDRLSSLSNVCKESVISSCSDEEIGQKELVSPAASDREVSSPLVSCPQTHNSESNGVGDTNNGETEVLANPIDSNGDGCNVASVGLQVPVDLKPDQKESDDVDQTDSTSEKIHEEPAEIKHEDCVSPSVGEHDKQSEDPAASTDQVIQQEMKPLQETTKSDECQNESNSSTSPIAIVASAPPMGIEKTPPPSPAARQKPPKPTLRTRKLTPAPGSSPVVSPILSPLGSPGELQIISEDFPMISRDLNLGGIQEDGEDETPCTNACEVPRKGAETSESGIDMEESSLYTDENIDEVLGEDVDDEGDFEGTNDAHNVPDSASELQRMRRMMDQPIRSKVIEQPLIAEDHTEEEEEQLTSSLEQLSPTEDHEVITRFDELIEQTDTKDTTKQIIEQESVARLDELLAPECVPVKADSVVAAEPELEKTPPHSVFSKPLSDVPPPNYENHIIIANEMLGLSSGEIVMFPLSPKSCIEPPREKPPPPPLDVSEDEEEPPKLPPKATVRRLDSTKRIKKEIRKKRSDFLGIEGSNDENYLEPEVEPPPDMTALLEEERRHNLKLYEQYRSFEAESPESIYSPISRLDEAHITERNEYRQSICSEADSTHETTESRDSGVELDHRDRIGNLSWTEPPAQEHVIDEDEIAQQEREIIEALENEEKWKIQQSNVPMDDKEETKVSEKLRELEEEKLKLEWARAEEEGKRMAEEERIHAKETLLRQQETSLATNQSPESEENLRSERERLEQEQLELARVRQRLLAEQQRPVEKPQQGPIGTNLRYSMPDLQEPRPAPINPRPSSSWSRIPSAENLLASNHHHPQQQMSRTTLNALSAVPRSRIVNGETWMQPKRKSEGTKSAYNYQHWLIQEAEHRRITEQQQRAQTRRSLPNQTRPAGNAPMVIPQHQPATPRPHSEHFPPTSSHVIPSSPSRGGVNVPYAHPVVSHSHSHVTIPLSPPHHPHIPPHSHIVSPPPHSGTVHSHNMMVGNRHNMVGLPAPHPHPPANNKPLPDSVIQTLTQRVQNKTSPKKRVEEKHSPMKLVNHESPYLNGEQERMLSVSGKKKCSHCCDELGRGAAMVIESLRLFYHIDCFKCCVCHSQLGDGLMGTDVRVRNNKLHCHNCYSSDDGVKFSCV